MTKPQAADRRGQDAPVAPNDNNGTETPAFPDETAHLAQILGQLEEAIGQADASVAHLNEAYTDTKSYMVQYRGEIDPREMFQNEMALQRIDKQGALAVQSRERLIKLKDSPYFARIDFRAAAADAPATHYIGRFAFSHNGRLLISDWRSPHCQPVL